MSQDTYEVIVQCMNLDPSKRSLVGARNALRRLVSFTTTDDSPDEFCSAERRTIASANREPLRTPSIQSPQVDTGSFPWAKALHASPRPVMRQLSVIHDSESYESYSEELFSKSEATTADWCSATTGQTPSMDSMLNSSLAASMKSLAINRPKMPRSSSKVSPMAGSLPITMSRQRNAPSMSLIFGRRDAVSKSWSDMWEEDVEEEEERTKQLQALKELNSRTWSQDSRLGAVGKAVEDDNTPRQGLSPAPKSAAINIHVPSIEHTISSNIDDDLVADGFFFYDASAEGTGEDEHHEEHQPLRQHASNSSAPAERYSPPPKRSTPSQDKWAALGERRRAYTGTSAHKSTPDLSLKSGRQAGHGFSSVGHGVWDHNAGQVQMNITQNYAIFSANNNHGHTSNKWISGNTSTSKDRATKDVSWNKARDLNWNWRRDRPGDVEWVGGWQMAHRELILSGHHLWLGYHSQQFDFRPSRQMRLRKKTVLHIDDFWAGRKGGGDRKCRHSSHSSLLSTRLSLHPPFLFLPWFAEVGDVFTFSCLNFPTVLEGKRRGKKEDCDCSIFFSFFLHEKGRAGRRTRMIQLSRPVGRSVGVWNEAKANHGERKSACVLLD